MQISNSFLKKVINITEDLGVIFCGTSEDFQYLKSMQKIAKQDTSFQYSDSFKAMLFINNENIIGFISWDKDHKEEKGVYNGGEILRQIYVSSELRRKGYGSLMLNYWVENVAKKTHDKFGVETSNPSSPVLPLLEKNGYLDKKNHPENSNCYFVPSM